MNKEFDCIDFKRRAQARIYEHIKDLRPEEEIDYFRQAAEQGELGSWWRGLRNRQEPDHSRPQTT